MIHKLILFYGSSPGAGKSTLSSRLNRQLQTHGRPVKWIYEDDVLSLECFAPVVDSIQGRSELALLEACMLATQRLVSRFAESDTLIVADSVLPYYDWLMAAGISDESIAAFSDRLWQVLMPLNPLIVYLNVDVEAALKRAVAYRGRAWLDDTIPFMNSWGINQAKPLSTLDDVIAYTQRVDQRKQQLLIEWPSDLLWLDSMADSIDLCVAAILDRLELQPGLVREERPSRPFSAYKGQYTAVDSELLETQHTIAVTVHEDKLWANLYWPNGCRLVFRAEDEFQLQDTSHWVQFVELQHKRFTQLRYCYRGEIYEYVRS